MRALMAGALTVVVLIALLVPSLKKYKGYILSAYAVLCMLLIALQTFRTANLTLPFYHAKEQMFYQEEFADEGLYPDAIIQHIVNGKTVYTKDDLDDYMASDAYANRVEDFFADGKYWLYAKYHQVNMCEFLEAAGAKVISEDSFNDKYISEEQLKDFEYAGMGNDLNRYLFLLSNIKEEWSNSFYYYWYYSCHIGQMDIYIQPDDIDNADEIVVLWDDQQNETLYIMTKEYYDQEVAYE